jgi:hypothetical protein
VCSTLQAYSLKNSSEVNRKRRAAKIIDSANHSVTAKMCVLRTHLAGVRLASQIVRDLIRVKWKNDLMPFQLDGHRNIIEVYAIVRGRRLHTRLAITIDALAKPKKSRFRAQASAQAELGRCIWASEVGSKCLVHAFITIRLAIDLVY